MPHLRNDQLRNHNSLDCPNCGKFISETFVDIGHCPWCQDIIPTYEEETSNKDFNETLNDGEFDEFQL